MLPKRIWLLLNSEDKVIAISFEELPPPHMAHVRRAVRYDCMLGKTQSDNGIPQLELFEGAN